MDEGPTTTEASTTTEATTTTSAGPDPSSCEAQPNPFTVGGKDYTPYCDRCYFGQYTADSPVTGIADYIACGQRCSALSSCNSFVFVPQMDIVHSLGEQYRTTAHVPAR